MADDLNFGDRDDGGFGERGAVKRAEDSGYVNNKVFGLEFLRAICAYNSLNIFISNYLEMKLYNEE